MPKRIKERAYSEKETEVLLLEAVSAHAQHIRDHNELAAEYERECL